LSEAIAAGRFVETPSHFGTGPSFGSNGAGIIKNSQSDLVLPHK
jgi:hypothetical protein